MEFNKLFAAILVAGVSAMLCGFVAKAVINVERPHENAYKIEVAEEAGAKTAVEPVAEPILALLASADTAKGQSITKVCGACHSFDKGGPAKVGPNLYGIVGAKHAHMEGFAYSDAMKALHDKDWTYAELNNFLWNPKKHINGTKMVYAGLKKPDDRAAVIAYLRTLADAPQALPTEGEIAAEAVKVEVENADVPQEDVEGQDTDASSEAGAEAPTDAKAAEPEAKKEDVKPEEGDKKADEKKE